jgi:hypothetical protein
VHTGFWWGKLRERRPRRRWKDNVKMDIQEVGVGAWTGLIRPLTGTGGGHL